ncbi:MAG: ACT domain-containing protein [Clostridia bacterium]|nr:ACT domain-containing protein [Clostridia bacterium]
MNDDYLIVSKSVLPDYFEKVVEARELLRSGEVREVSEAARRVGISRSTYYKYKDCAFTMSQGDSCRKAVISMILRHEKGILGKVLGVLSDNGANILTITQNPPIGSRASVVVSMDISGLVSDINDLISVLAATDGVEHPALIDMA